MNTTYSRSEIRKLADHIVLSAMALYNAYAYRNELTNAASEICSQELVKETYTQEEKDAIIETIDSAVYELID